MGPYPKQNLRYGNNYSNEVHWRSGTSLPTLAWFCYRSHIILVANVDGMEKPGKGGFTKQSESRIIQ